MSEQPKKLEILNQIMTFDWKKDTKELIEVFSSVSSKPASQLSQEEIVMILNAMAGEIGQLRGMMKTVFEYIKANETDAN